MSNAFLIRTARQHDLGELTDVLTNSFHTQDGALGWIYPLLRLGIYEDLRNRLRSKAPYHVCLVAVEQPGCNDLMHKVHLNTGIRPHSAELVAGTVEIGLRPHTLWQPRDRQYLYLSNLAVRQDYRRQGVGGQLLRSCERVALDWGYKDLYLHVLENNHAARRLYLKAGYRIQQMEWSLGSWFLKRPRQLFLHKHFG